MIGRTIFMRALREVAQQLSGGKYFVKRGYINWATWNFDGYPRALSIMLDEHQFLTTDGTTEATVSFECFMRVDTSPEVMEIDDASLEEIITYLASILDQLEQERMREDPAYPVAFSIKRNSARAVEAHDAEMRIQGVTATFEVKF